MRKLIVCYGQPMHLDDIIVGAAEYFRRHRPDVRLRAKTRADAAGMKDAVGVIAHLASQGITETCQSLDIPIVNTSGRMDQPTVPTVTFDDQAIAQLAFEHFHHRAFRSFASIWRDWEGFSVKRAEAFSALGKAAGAQVTSLKVDAPETSPDTLNQVSDWIADLPKPTGLFASNDNLAVAAVEAAAQVGITVPDDIAIVGVSNTPRLCLSTSPTITSVALPLYAIGYEAARAIDLLLQGQQPERLQLIKPERLIERESSDCYATNDPLVNRAMAVLGARLADGINVDELVRELGVGRRTLELRFRDALGRSPLQEIHRRRIDWAAQLLTGAEYGIQEIAKRVGFGNARRFREVFRKHTGLSPSDYREERENARRG